MKTLLYEVVLRDPITKAVYPEEYVGLLSIVGVTPGGRFEIEVRVNFEAIPTKNDLLPQTVEVEVTVNGQANPWVFDVTAQIPVCTFVGCPDNLGQVVPYAVPANLPTLVPGDSARVSTDGNDDDQEWVDELFTIQVNATVIYSYVETTNPNDDPVPSDFFTFPTQTLYYHSPGTMKTLNAHYTKQNRSSAKALDHALTAAISAAAYDDFYADNYDPNDDSDDDDLQSDDDGSDIYEVDAQGNRKPRGNGRGNGTGTGGDDDSGNEDDWWGAAAQPQATKAIQQQKDRHQQLVQQQQQRQRQTSSVGATAGAAGSSSGAAAAGTKHTTTKRSYGAISTTAHDDSSDSERDVPPPAKRSAASSSALPSSSSSSMSLVPGLPVLTAVPTAPPLPTITSTFSHRLPVADSDSEDD